MTSPRLQPAPILAPLNRGLVFDSPVPETAVIQQVFGDTKIAVQLNEQFYSAAANVFGNGAPC